MAVFFKKIIYLLLVTVCISNVTTFAANDRVTNYHRLFIPSYTKNGDLRVVIRMYYLNNIPYFLVVNPETFATEAAPARNFKSRKEIGNAPGYFTMQELQATPYLKALIKYTSSRQNEGITRAENSVNGAFITADMCPSVKPFEKEFFNTLVAIAKKNHQPTPVALSITGLWIITHPQEFNWLIEQENKNKLKITWINHSFSHVYYADLPFEKNFLLEPQTNISHEILATEKLLIEHGQLPSVFFRFPGLVADEKLFLKLRKYGLIPIGADAWLAKDQQPKQGSFILVHGNANEPEGIKKIMPLLLNDSYHWLPLNEAFVKQ